MTTYQTLRTDVWTIDVPEDWTQKPTADQGAVYFEAADGTKGLYMTTWSLGEGDERTAPEVVQAFKERDVKALHVMQGYSWEVLLDISGENDGAYASVTDYLAEAKHYRTIGKILAAPPLVVRASFQDYDCKDVEVSSTYFQHIIDSLQFYRAQ